MSERGKRLTIPFINELRRLIRQEMAKYQNERPVRQRWFNTSRKPAGKIELSHGIIIATCNANCGTYRVQRVRRTLLSECDDCGSGSGS